MFVHPLNPPPAGDSVAFGVSAVACALEHCFALTLGVALRLAQVLGLVRWSTTLHPLWGYHYQ